MTNRTGRREGREDGPGGIPGIHNGCPDDRSPIRRPRPHPIALPAPSGGHRVDDGLSTPFPAGQKWWRNGWRDMQGERPEFSREIALTDQFARKYIGRLFTKHTLLHGLATAHTPRLRLYFSKINWWQKLNSCINYQMAI